MIWLLVPSAWMCRVGVQKCLAMVPNTNHNKQTMNTATVEHLQRVPRGQEFLQPPGCLVSSVNAFLSVKVGRGCPIQNSGSLALSASNEKKWDSVEFIHGEGLTCIFWPLNPTPQEEPEFGFHERRRRWFLYHNINIRDQKR